MTPIELSPATLAEQMRRDAVVLIDVREAHEHAAEHIPGAIPMPLSTLDPAAIPQIAGKTVVLHCARGGRSAQALQRCRNAGVPVETHLAGGLIAWKQAGLPTASAASPAPPGVLGQWIDRWRGR
jgi:rhodanese-related sulfurtransferase